MNLVFTCGGTAGHINPAIAVANTWRERRPQDKILFIGSKDNMEEELVPKAGYEIVTFRDACLERGLSFAALKYNFQAVGRIAKAVSGCKKTLKEFDADIVVGTGGYASFPALLAARLLKLPTCVHESNALPGLTTKLAAAFADRVMVCFPESVSRYRNPKKVEVVGMPVRREFLFGKKEQAKKELGLTGRPVVVSAFGSQGARDMNLVIGELFRLEQDQGFPFHHIHAVGSYGWEWMPDHVRAQGVDLAQAPEIDMRPYIYDMPQVMAAADVYIGRAGSSTCNEIAASGVPCILIPSPNVTNNHQENNARVLADAGGAVLLPEAACDAKRLMQEIQGLLGDEKRRQGMSAALQRLAVPDSAQRICQIMAELTAKD